MPAKRVVAVSLGGALLIIIAVGGIVTGGQVAVITVAAFALPVAVSIAIVRPAFVAYALAGVAGLVPFASVGLIGVQLQVVVLLSALLLGGNAMRAMLTVERAPKTKETGRAKVLIALYICASLLSFVATRGRFGVADDTEFVKWLLLAAVPLALLPMAAVELRRFFRTFAVAIAVSAGFAFLTLIPTAGASLLRTLAVVGYQRSEDDQRYFLQNGEAVGSRLAGTFVDPNIAGLFFFAGVCLSLIYFRAKTRVLLVLIMSTAIILTLSRGAILAISVAMILVVLLTRGQMTRRLTIVIALFGSALMALSVPVVRARVLGTFGSADVGSVDRVDALSSYVDVMKNEWIFGLGWGRPEFRDAADSYAVNMVANAPLAAIYRGGLVAGVALVALLILIVAIGVVRLRSDRWTDGILGGVAVGFVLAIQTGYAVITIGPMILLLGLIVVAVVRNDAVPPRLKYDTSAVGNQRAASGTPKRSLVGAHISGAIRSR